MSDDRWNQPDGDFADEPTDPGIQPGVDNSQQLAHGQQPWGQQGATQGPAQPEAMSNLGFRPQTGAFGAVDGQPTTSEQANPFGTPASNPNYSQQGSQASIQGPQGNASGGFPQPGSNPSGAFNANTGEFGSSVNNTGNFAAPQPNSSGRGESPPSASGSFSAPMTGGFQAVPGQQQQGSTPQTSGSAQAQPGPSGQFQSVPGAQTGAFQNVPGVTGQFQAPAGQPLQVGEYEDGPPEPTLKVRATFGLGGFLLGAIAGLALGLLNSVFEGVGVLDGMSVTLQISLWFGGTIALICAWKPGKVWETLEEYGFFD